MKKKQCDPNKLLRDPAFDELDFALLSLIIAKTAKEDTKIMMQHGGRTVTIDIKKGDAILPMNKLSRVFSCDRRVLTGRVKSIVKWNNMHNNMYNNMYIKRTAQGLCVSTVFDTEDKKMHNSMYNNMYNKKDVEIYEKPAEFASLLWSRIQKNNPQAKQPDLAKWAAEMERTIRIDKREEKAVRFLILWSQENHFWKGNILSPAKLRKHFDTLYAQSKAEYDEKQNAKPINPIAYF